MLPVAHPLAIVGLLLVLAAGCATAPLVRGSSDSLSQLARRSGKDPQNRSKLRLGIEPIVMAAGIVATISTTRTR